MIQKRTIHEQNESRIDPYEFTKDPLSSDDEIFPRIQDPKAYRLFDKQSKSVHK